MNLLVPDFGIEDEYAIHTSTAAGGGGGVSRPRKSPMADDDIMELLWQDGQVVMQSQNKRTGAKKSSPSPFKIAIGDAVLHMSENEIRTHSTAAPAPEDVSNAHQLFMQEDEMASWLHYPLDDTTTTTSFERIFSTDFLYPPPPPSTTVTVTAAANVAVSSTAAATEVELPRTSLAVAARSPVVPPPVRVTTEDVDNFRFSNFVHFSRTKNARPESGPSESNKDEGRQSTTVIDSSITPAIEHDSRVSQLIRTTGGEFGNRNIAAYGRSMSGAAMASTSSAGIDMSTCDLMVTSTSGGFAASISASVEPTTCKPHAEARKRKARQRAADEAECYSEDVEFESTNAKKPARGSTSAKRSHAAEVHNLSERRRRDRINVKMKALQELIPRCNKADKASMLDEAIEYLKSLQLQVQMMSMGCSMVPMMFPGGQHYMPPMGMGMGMGMEMGMGMGMGVGMDMSMSRPMVPYPSVFAGSTMQNPSTSSHMGPRFPMPAYHMEPVPPPDLSRLQTTNQSDPTLNPMASQNPSQPRLPNFCDPYQRYLDPHQMQLPIPQNQAMTQPNTH